MYPSGRKKKCTTSDCENTIPIELDFCAYCRQRNEEKRIREEARLRKLAEIGIGRLEHLLERHAEFEELYGPE